VSLLLDTNVVSEAMNKTPDLIVVRWFADNQEFCFLTSIVIAQIELGLELLPHGQRKERLHEAFFQFRSPLDDRLLPFDAFVARRWATLCAQLERRGRKTTILDSMIEATALKWGLTIVMRNEDDFAEAPTLNPWKAAE
jgi:predicted nucleic acid-binding protein